MGHGSPGGGASNEADVLLVVGVYVCLVPGHAPSAQSLSLICSSDRFVVFVAPRMPEAFEGLDAKKLHEYFDVVSKAPAATEVKEEVADEDDDEGVPVVAPSTALPASSSPGVKTTKTDKKPVELPLPTSAIAFASGMIDRCLQTKLFNLAADDDDAFVSGIVDFVDDGAATLARWRDVFGDSSASLEFSEILEAVLNVCRCSLPDASGHPMPSVLRVSRQKVHMAAKAAQGPQWRIASAMSHHPGARKALDLSRQVAASSLADAASDDLYDNLAEEIEARMAVAFDDGIAQWSERGLDGKPLNIEACKEFVTFARSISSQMIVVASQWSLSPLEQRLEEVVGTCESLCAILHVASWVAARAFEIELPALAKLFVDDTTTSHMEEGATEVKGEPDEDASFGDAQLAVDIGDPSAPAPTSLRPRRAKSSMSWRSCPSLSVRSRLGSRTS